MKFNLEASMDSDKIEYTLNNTRICGSSYFRSVIEISNVVYEVHIMISSVKTSISHYEYKIFTSL